MIGKQSRKRGRKPGASQPVNEQEASASRLVLLRLAKINAWKVSQITTVLADFPARHPNIAKLAEIDSEDAFTLDDAAMRSFLKEGRNDAQVKKVIHLWISTEHNDLYQLYLDEEYLKVHEQFVIACKALLGHAPDTKTAKARSFGGVYRLYRPFHLNPKASVTVGLLTIGGPDTSPFECLLHERFPDGKRICNTYATGRMVPHGSRMMAILQTTDGSRSHFILHFGAIEREAVPPGSGNVGALPPVESLSGIMIAAVGADAASAWPCYAERVPANESAISYVATDEGLAELSAPVRRALDRGAVYWRESDHPKPFG